MAKGLDEERREQLLAQIEALVLAEGFSGLRVGELADRLKCSRSTLYKLAPSKDDLVLLVFRRLLARSFDRCRAEALKYDDPGDRIRAYFSTTESARAETSVQYWMDVQTWGPTERLRKEAHRMVADDVTGFIVDGIARGIFRPVNPRFVAYLAWLGSVSSHQPAFLEETGMTWAEAMEGIADLLVAGLSVDRAAQAEAGGAA